MITKGPQQVPQGGSNPLPSAALRDPRDISSSSINEIVVSEIVREIVVDPSLARCLQVLKRGTAPSLGGLTSRLSLFCDILPRVFYHA
jgi:hypothetical protein